MSWARIVGSTSDFQLAGKDRIGDYDTKAVYLTSKDIFIGRGRSEQTLRYLSVLVSFIKGRYNPFNIESLEESLNN
jgi:hypothetical protein